MTLPTLPDPKEAEAEARHKLTLLCDELRELNMSDGISLPRQAQLLEYAFALLLRKGFTPTTFDKDASLRLAMISQRQCVETLRTETAMRYMESCITAPGINTDIALPHPLPGKAPK